MDRNWFLGWRDSLWQLSGKSLAGIRRRDKRKQLKETEIWQRCRSTAGGDAISDCGADLAFMFLWKCPLRPDGYSYLSALSACQRPFSEVQEADIFSQVAPKRRPRGEGATLPAFRTTAMLATTESTSSTSLLIDLLSGFTQWQLLHEPRWATLLWQLPWVIQLAEMGGGSMAWGRYQVIWAKRLVPESVFPVKLAGIRFGPLEEAGCIAND